MKNSVKALLMALLIALSAIFCVGCGSGEEPQQSVSNVSESSETGAEDTSASDSGEENASSVWDSAKYTEDTDVGEGGISVQVEVIADDRSVTLTVHTDKVTLGGALLDNDLASGDEGEYGLYIKFVNGMEADFDKDGTYWSISRDGEYLMTGADSTPIADGEHYELTRTKG